ncbi:hypothetical protein C2E15_03655 [Mixta gaviniae]|uniref:Uncharacterized protein n=1 Tax=Mixta gaviniae TaxID=665914 RepID=A0A2L0ICE1_9GAMM|nr:hypothetical protein C2E15_03655 [Mixta gaviniae]
MVNKGVLVFIRNGDFCIIKVEERYYISVLFPNFYRNSHFDVSKDFLLDIHEIIERRDFDKLTLLAEGIRRNYEKYKDKEVEEVEEVEVIKEKIIQ